ncbi:nose resistant to fluoxetine protein 6 [Phlebotomus argentipes]|uniref:nose resistant to fluoxetine protein 6 n=1 Tax=Phlebotomus argentipes TaxID=94469 RepID=UPI002892CA15|nr:nose resistant to fluoxetine protein 6 [Phlebotomus argentipes]
MILRICLSTILWFTVIVNAEVTDDNANLNTQQLEINATDYVPQQRLRDLLDLFNIASVAASWPRIAHDVRTPNCSLHMVDYFRGLATGKLWAMKMDDASGHYSPGFFFGNNYWMGSINLCSAIASDEAEKVIKFGEAKAGLSSAVSYRHDGRKMRNDRSPFVPGFFVLKLNFHASNLTHAPRTLYIGLCLPSSCTEADVLAMAKNLHEDKNEGQSHTTILDVRSPTKKRYEFTSDPTFYILLVTVICVSCLLIAGTIYDLILIRRSQKCAELKAKSKELATDLSSGGLGCITYDLTSAMPNREKMEKARGLNNNNSDENLAVESLDHQEETRSVFAEMLLSFSVVTNFKAICDSSVGSDTISSIHGLRAVSMAWVILGHTCIIVFKYSDNMDLRKTVEKEFWFQTITNGAFSVDTFFFISGFLVAYIYFRTNAKGKLEKLSKGVNEVTAGALHFIGLVGYRFMRLTAPYLFVLGCVELLMKYFEQYSVFEPPTMDHDNCPKFWWRNVLYINTLFPVEEMCMLWSWYLANDTQFYIIGAVILIVAVRHLRVAAAVVSVIMVCSWAITGLIAYNNNHIPNTDDPLALFDMIYDKPWTRIGPYMIGMSVGWILFRSNCQLRMSRLTVALGWMMSSAVGLYLIYGLYGQELNQLGGAAYSSLSHSAWALSLAWIIIACSTGHGGYVNTFLSAPCIYPFSRATYCAYLVHPIVIRIMALNSTAPLHLGTDSMMVYFFGQLVCSYLLAFIVSLAFEAPVVTMLKILKRI